MRAAAARTAYAARLATCGALAATLATCATLAAATFTATTWPAQAATPAKPVTITRSAHLAFEGCNARHIVLTVTVQSKPFPSDKPVTLAVRLANTGGTPCGTPANQHAALPAHRSLNVGPCGNLSLVVRTTQGTDVFPGKAVFFCPEERGVGIGAHSTVRTTADWDLVAYTTSATSATSPQGPPQPGHAPPGRYRVTVAGVVSVPITLAPSSS